MPNILDFDEDQKAAALALLSEEGEVWTEAQLLEALSVIATVALGDRVGTVREHPNGGAAQAIMLRIEDEFGRRRWKLVQSDGGSEIEFTDNAEIEQSWPKVHAPEAD